MVSSSSFIDEDEGAVEEVDYGKGLYKRFV
jgi:hypothetical protein